MQSIVKSVSGPQFLVSSPGPFLQPPLTSFRVLIIGDTRKVNMSCYVKAKTRRGDPNHFIFFLFILIVRQKKPFVYEVGISYGLDTWSLSVCLEVSCLCDIKFLDNLPTTLLTLHQYTQTKRIMQK